MAKYATLDDMIYFDQKQTAWNKDHFVLKEEGKSLIEDTTLASVKAHLEEIASDSDTTAIQTALDDYFNDKTLVLFSPDSTSST